MTARSTSLSGRASPRAREPSRYAKTAPRARKTGVVASRIVRSSMRGTIRARSRGAGTIAPMTAAYSPTREEFVALAREYTLVPVWREVLGDLETPVGVYRKLG